MVQNTAVTKLKAQVIENRQKSKPIEELINKSLKELGKAVPSCMSAERLARIAFTTIRLNPKLADCTPESFLGALFQSAQLGLEPNVEGQAYIIPCHRVVFADGRLSPAFAFGGENEQRRLLEEEGVIFNGEKVDKSCFYKLI